MPNKSWGATRRGWLGSLTFTYAIDNKPSRRTCTRWTSSTTASKRSSATLTRPQRRPVGPARRAVALPAGVDTLTALGLVAEIGTDWSHFKTAEQFMSYLGLIPSEASSSQSRRQGSITKAGNSHVRRLLVEAAWHQRQRPRVGAALAARPGAHREKAREAT